MGNGIRSVLIVCFILYCNSIAAAWTQSPPEKIAETVCLFPQVAMDSAGNAIAIWESICDGCVVQASYKPANGSWGLAETLSEIGVCSYFPQIAMDHNGNAIAVWYAADSNYIVVQSKYRPAGGHWDSSSTTLSDSDQNAVDPQIAMDTHGNAIAVWSRSDGATDIVQAKYKAYGKDWNKIAENLSEIGKNSNYPQIAMDPSGNAVAVWVASNGNEGIIQSKNKPFNKNWSSEVANLSKTGGNAECPQIAIDGKGNAIAIWSRYDGFIYSIQAKSNPFNGNWDNQEVTLSQQGQSARNPYIAMNSMGNAVAIWKRFNGANDIVQAKSKLFNGDWDSVAVNLSQTKQNAGSPQIAMDERGNAIAVWSSFNGSSYVVQAEHRSSSGAWDMMVVNLSEVKSSATLPGIAMDPGGNAIALWSLSSPCQVLQARKYVKD